MTKAGFGWCVILGLALVGCGDDSTVKPTVIGCEREDGPECGGRVPSCEPSNGCPQAEQGETCDAPCPGDANAEGVWVCLGDELAVWTFKHNTDAGTDGGF